MNMQPWTDVVRLHCNAVLCCQTSGCPGTSCPGNKGLADTPPVSPQGGNTNGMGGGNIIESGTKALCTHYCDTFDEILAMIK
jgi:hypothetical protein